MPKTLLLLLLTLSLPACMGPRVLPELPTAGVELSATPFHPQQRYQCGPAALATVLQTAGVDTSPEALVDHVWLPERRGSLQLELLAATRRHDRVAYVLEPQIGAMLAELQAGRPVLVMMNLGTRWYPLWHFAVVIGFEAEGQRILLRSGTTERLALALGRFLRSWELAQSWAMVALEADQLPAAADRRRYLTALADLERTERPAIAVGGYEAWLASNPQDTLALFGLANSQLARGNPTAAEAAYERLLKLRPGDAAASNNLARLLLNRGCAASARRVLAEMAELIPASMADAVQTTRSHAAGGDDAACREGPSDGNEDVGDAHQFEH